MPIQSYLMMYFAGSAWQYGKRKISAMSNEEFNKLDMKTLLEQHTMELKSVIPTLERSLNDVTPLVAILIEQYGDFIKEALKAVPQALLNAIGQGGGEFSNIPTTQSQTTSGLPPAQMASFLHYFKQLSDATNKQATPIIQKQINLNAPSTISGLTIGQAQEQAKQKQLAHEAQLRANEKLKKDFDQKQIQIEPQLGIIESQGGQKKKAGQSQILERNKLIKSIAYDANLLKQFQLQGKATGTTYTGVLQRLHQSQQLLVNLLARYDFS